MLFGICIANKGLSDRETAKTLPTMVRKLLENGSHWHVKLAS